MSGHRLGSENRARGGLRPLLLAVMLVAAGLLLFSAAGCGDAEPEGQAGPQATLALISPTSPLGLHYGEQVTLLLRYRHLGQAMAGVTLTLHIDSGDASENSGATLSADRVVTNDHGEASVLLTAGAAEAAFHVMASGPLAPDLSIDVAVSRYAFGNLDVLLDATFVPGAVALTRAALVTGTSCAALGPTPKLGPVLRSQQANMASALLPFSTLLVQPYSVIGRAEDSNGRLLAYGCVDLPDQLLRTGLRATIPLPLSLVFPSPVGSYALTLKLKTAPATPGLSGLYGQLACADGPGQVLLDALLSAIPTADSDLAMRLAALRPVPDDKGCRVGTSEPDGVLEALLEATTAGTSLGPVCVDVAAVQGGVELSSRLAVTAATGRDVVAAHTLNMATLSTASRMASYSLATVPVPAAVNLALQQNGAMLVVPEHALTLRLPALWRRALGELVLTPRGLTMTPAQLFQSAVAQAQSGGRSGCDAVEAVLCGLVASPCAGKLVAPCLAATSDVSSRISHALDDAPAGYDLYLAFDALMEDPGGTLEAQTLDAGKVSGRIESGAGELTLDGTATGERMP